MKATWPLQDAKNRFSEVVDHALTDGPQMVTRRGQEAVVVVSVKDYRRMLQSRTQLVDFFRKSPLAGLDIEFSRSADKGRSIDL